MGGGGSRGSEKRRSWSPEQGRCRQTDGVLQGAGGGLCTQMRELLCPPGAHPLHFHFHLPDVSVLLASLVGFYRIISCMALVAGNRLT